MKHTPGPWNERVPTFSINPDAATREDIARMAAEIMELRRLLQHAVSLIKAWHHFGYRTDKEAEKFWRIYYEHSPEMVAIRKALK